MRVAHGVECAVYAGCLRPVVQCKEDIPALLSEWPEAATECKLPCYVSQAVGLCTAALQRGSAAVLGAQQAQRSGGQALSWWQVAHQQLPLAPSVSTAGRAAPTPGRGWERSPTLAPSAAGGSPEGAELFAGPGCGAQACTAAGHHMATVRVLSTAGNIHRGPERSTPRRKPKMGDAALRLSNLATWAVPARLSVRRGMPTQNPVKISGAKVQQLVYLLGSLLQGHSMPRQQAAKGGSGRHCAAHCRMGAGKRELAAGLPAVARH